MAPEKRDANGETKENGVPMSKKLATKVRVAACAPPLHSQSRHARVAWLTSQEPLTLFGSLAITAIMHPAPSRFRMRTLTAPVTFDEAAS